MSDAPARRRDRLAATLRAEGIEALLVASEANVGYLTGFRGDSAVLLVLRHRAVIVSDGRYAQQLSEECPGLEMVLRPVGETVWPTVSRTVAALGIRRLGFESQHLTVAQFEELKSSLATVAFKPVADRVEALRAVKDRTEIAAIREAIRIAERAFTMLKAGLRPGDSEKEIADTMEANLRRCGATASSFPPIVAVGPNAAQPHYRPSATRRLGVADFVLIDWGASCRPYKSDLTRVVATGKVTPKLEKVYRSVLAAQERAIAAIRPGVPTGEVDAATRAELAAWGYSFDHGLGHGVGIEIHEAPWLKPQAEAVLQPGMVLTVEPGVYLPGWGGVRIEDDVLVTPEGCEVLSRVPKSLDTIRV